MHNTIQHLKKLCNKRLIPITEINDAMKKININKFKSSVQYNCDHPKRNIIYIDNRMAIHTIGFMSNQYLPLQYYGKFNVFFTVIEGEIVEYVHIKPHLITRHFIHRVGNGHYINEFIGYNQFYNKSKENCSILQLFVM